MRTPWMFLAVLTLLASATTAQAWPPQARNSNGSTTPNAPSTIYLGDTGLTFGCDAWGQLDGAWGGARVYIHTGSDIHNGTPGADFNYTEYDPKWNTSAQFTQTGTWYWSILMHYDPWWGEHWGWYCRNDSNWHNMWETPTANLTVNVLALVNPSSQTATAASQSQINLGWTRGTSGTAKNTVIFRSTSSTAPTPAGGTAYSSGQNYTLGGISYRCIYNGSGTSTSDTSLSSGTRYYYYFFAVNNNYYSPGVSANAWTIPPNPTSSAASGIGQTVFVANWSAATGATGYRLDVSTSSGFGTFVSGYQNLDVGNVTSRSVSGLDPDTTYYYRVRAYNTGGTSGNSGTQSATTAAASTVPILSAPTATSITQSGATLGATIDADGGESITSRGTVWGTSANPTGNALAAGGTGLGAFSHARSGMTAGTLIYYRGYAVNSVGTGYSPDGTFWTVPPDPTSSAATGVGQNEFTANWSAATGATGYRLDVATDSGFTSMVGGYNNLDVGLVTSREVTGLDPDTPYWYRVRAYNTGGTSGNSSSQSVQTDPPPPNYGMRDDAGVNLPTLTYWYSGAPSDVTEKGADFDSTDLGEITALYIKGANIKTWKNEGAGGDVTGTKFLYKVWEQGTGEPGSYTERGVGWTSNDGGGNQTWASFGAEINIFSGLEYGEYNLKIMFTVQGTGVPGMTENGPFTATFTFAPPPPPDAKNPDVPNPTTAYLGDMVALHADTYQAWEGNNRSWARIIGRWNNVNLTTGTVQGDGRVPGHEADDTWANTPRLGQVGTFYWAMLVAYQEGNDFYYDASRPSWSAMAEELPSSATLSITVSALQNPIGLSADPNSTHAATRADLGWTAWEGRNVLITRSTASPSGSPSQGTGYSPGNTFGNQTVIVGSEPGGSSPLTVSGLTPGQKYYFTFYSENYNYYSGGATVELTMEMPRAVNTGEVATPEQPAAVYLGDTGRTFGLESWGTMEGQWSDARLWIRHGNANVSGGTSGDWRGATDQNHKQVASPQFTETGTWYWGIQNSYGDYGVNFWYKASNASWTQMSADGDGATLSVTVNALGVPSAFNATADGRTAIDLSWSKWEGRNVLIVRRTGAAVSWSPTQGVTYSDDQAVNGHVIIRGSSDATGLKDEGLASDTTYHYAIFSENYGYYSAAATASATTDPGATVPLLSTPTVSGITQSGATLGATIDSDGGEDITERGTVWGTSANPTGNALAAGGTGLGAFSHARSGMTAGTLIYYCGYADNSEGRGYSADGSFWTIPPDPTASAASAVGSSSFQANWSAATGATGYRLDVATDSGFTSMVSGYDDLDVGLVTSRSVTGLTPDTPYWYRVRAYNTGGTSGDSASIMVTTEEAVIPDPPAPDEPEAIAPTGFTAKWGTSTGATGYRLDVATDPDFTSYVGGYQNKEVSATSDPVTGLAQGQAYYYRVRAFNDEGTSANSDVVGVMDTAIQPGFQMWAPPFVLADRDLDGALGALLAASLTGAGSEDGADKLYVMDGQSFRAFWLNSSNGQWYEGASPTGFTLPEGRGLFIQRNQGTSTDIGVSGAVGNPGTKELSIGAGYNLVSLSEGRSFTVSSFENTASGSPIGNYLAALADQVIIPQADGSWRRLVRHPDGSWYDLSARSYNNSYPLKPGEAYYYYRQSGSMDVLY